MNRSPLSPSQGALDLLEEAAQLLRRAPVSVLAVYYLGSIPFGLGFLYFWADMSCGADASRNLSQEAFGVALLFLWMKCWQTFFTRVLWTRLSGETWPAWTWGRWLKTLFLQITLQPLGFLAIPLAALLTLPFAWVYAFFQNVTVMGEGSEMNLNELGRKAWRQACLWPRQNNCLIAFVSLFALFVFLDLASATQLGPWFLKSFLGIETALTRSPKSFFNTTLFAVLCVLTYLCVDPLLKAAYALRCFYGGSLLTGEDLKAELKTSAAPFAAMALAVFWAWGCATFAQAAETSPGPMARQTVQSVQAPELDKAIAEALQDAEFRWHEPRMAAPETGASEPGIIGKFLEASLRFLTRVGKRVGRWIREGLQWIYDHWLRYRHLDRQVKSSEWDFEWLNTFLWVLLGAAACALALLIYRLWSRREKTVVLSQAVPPKPDIADARVSGEELPMDGWMRMAQDLLGQGKFRLALRAFYLASLACLARQKLLTLAKFKSTLDYERELNRRAHGLPQVLPVFNENGRVFDRGWYGNSDVTREMVETFAVNHEKIRLAVEPPLPTGQPRPQ